MEQFCKWDEAVLCARREYPDRTVSWGRDHSAEQRAHAGCSGGGSVEGRKDFQTGSGVEHGRKKDVELRGNGWVSQN